MSSSRIAAFYRLTVEERRRKLAEALDLSHAEVEALEAADALPLDVADIMVENAVATFALPFGVALNFQVNGRDMIIPMVVEEPSVIAAASNAALVARAGGGFVAEADPGAMIGQIQLVQVPDPGPAMERLYAARDRILTRAETLTPRLCRRGARPRRHGRRGGRRADALRLRARMGRSLSGDDPQQGHHERHRRRRGGDGQRLAVDRGRRPRLRRARRLLSLAHDVGDRGPPF